MYGSHFLIILSHRQLLRVSNTDLDYLIYVYDVVLLYFAYVVYMAHVSAVLSVLLCPVDTSMLPTYLGYTCLICVLADKFDLI